MASLRITQKSFPYPHFPNHRPFFLFFGLERQSRDQSYVKRRQYEYDDANTADIEWDNRGLIPTLPPFPRRPLIYLIILVSYCSRCGILLLFFKIPSKFPSVYPKLSARRGGRGRAGPATAAPGPGPRSFYHRGLLFKDTHF